MNETVELLQSRRSTPANMLATPGPDATELEALLTIASRVPDHGKLAPWRFIVIEGEARQRVGEIVAGAFQADNPEADADRLALERGRFSRAPVVVAVVSRVAAHPKIPEWEQVLSAGAACQNLLIAAASMGFGANWITEWVAYDRRVLDALGLGSDERIAGYVHIGTAREKLADRPRPSLSQIVVRL